MKPGPTHMRKAGERRTDMPKDMVAIPGGEFLMGSGDFYPEEAPVHRVAGDAFWIDEHPVTVAEFRRFVKDRSQRCGSEDVQSLGPRREGQALRRQRSEASAPSRPTVNGRPE